MDRDPGGLLVCHKPEGPSSHAAVARVRRALGARKAGHAGTLDPMASGVLLVGLNRSTRLLEYLVGHDKTYRARVRLGEVRDTLDREGELLETRPVPDLDPGRVEAVLARFRGRIEQVPPDFSAIKVGGEPLYRKRRRGEAVCPPPRTVEIRELRLIRVEPPDIELEVTCSAGTYVRSLARDLGEALGCGASLWGLVRVRSGPFSLGDAVPLEEVEALGPGAWDRVLPPERMVPGLPGVRLSPDQVARVLNGRDVPWDGDLARGPVVALLDPLGRLVGVGRVEGRALRPAKVLRTPAP